MLILRRIIWVSHVVRVGEMTNAYSILVAKRERKRPLRRPRRRWEDIIKGDIQE
jgi:hypothetical protein